MRSKNDQDLSMRIILTMKTLTGKKRLMTYRTMSIKTIVLMTSDRSKL